MLGAWILWKERNNIVFNGVSPRLDRALLLAQDEADHWMLAGAKGLKVWWLLLVVVVSGSYS